MSETTKPTPKKGHPAKAKEAATITPVASIPTPKPTPTPRPRVRRQEKVNPIREYRLSKKSGATFLMQQKNVTTVKDGALREIRYCPNEPSIYRDEQSDKSIRQAIIFTDGAIYVRPDQPNLAAYLDAHPDNGSRFYLVDEKAKATKELDDQFLEHDAITLVRTKDLDELLSVAVSFNINIDKPVNEIKHDLMVNAKKNPKAFIQSFDNPVVEMKTKMSQADKYQIIKVNADGIYWKDTNRLIISVPTGKDPMDTFVRWCLTEAAAPTVAEIEKQLG